MAEPYPTDDPLLRGAFQPIRLECDYADLVVEGDVPRALKGTLYRIGPNPQFPPRGVYNPLQGEGMIHAFEIENGRIAYRNRWVRSPGRDHRPSPASLRSARACTSPGFHWANARWRENPRGEPSRLRGRRSCRCSAETGASAAPGSARAPADRRGASAPNGPGPRRAGSGAVRGGRGRALRQNRPPRPQGDLRPAQGSARGGTKWARAL